MTMSKKSVRLGPTTVPAGSVVLHTYFSDWRCSWLPKVA